MTRKQAIKSLAILIDDRPDLVIKALQESGVRIKGDANKSVIVTYTANSLHDNKEFTEKLAKLISQDEYSNAIPAIVGTIITAVPALGSLFTSGGKQRQQSEAQLELERERTRQELYKALGQKQRKSALPIVIVGGVLVIGGIAVFMALRKK